MHELPDPTPRTSSDGVEGWEELQMCGSADELAFVAELTELDRQDRESGDWYDADCDEPPAWEAAPASDDDLVASLQGPAHPANLMLLDSIDPRSLSENLNRVDYLRALDRVGGLVAAKRQDVIVAMAGESTSQAYLSEVHLEHELSVAARSSRYAAERGFRARPRHRRTEKDPALGIDDTSLRRRRRNVDSSLRRIPSGGVP